MRYKETQEIKYVWLWIGLVSAFIVIFNLLIGFATTRNIQAMTIITVSVISVLMALFFKSMRLTLIVDETGISYKLFPFHPTLRRIPWIAIERCEVRTYNPIREYGGWGLKYGRRSGKAITISGNTGLQLYLKTGKKLLIGTRQDEKLTEYLKMIGKI